MKEQEQIFREHLRTALRAEKEKGYPLTEQELKEIFEELALEEGRLSMIRDYLKEAGAAGEEAYVPEGGEEYLSVYMEELRAMEPYTEEQKKDFARRAMQGEKEAADLLVQAYLLQAAEIAGLYAGQGVSPEDLIGEGNIGLLKAAGMAMCCESPEEVEGFLCRMVMDAMEAAVADRARTREFDEQILIKVNRINSKAEEMALREERQVTVEELSQEMEYSAGEIREALRVSGARPGYLKEERETDCHTGCAHDEEGFR